MQNRELAEKIVTYMNDLLLNCDRQAIGAMIGNRVPCNKFIADHPTCQVIPQNGGFQVGLLGILNGLCGVDEFGIGAVQAVFGELDSDEDSDLIEFRVSPEVDG